VPKLPDTSSIFEKVKKMKKEKVSMVNWKNIIMIYSYYLLSALFPWYFDLKFFLQFCLILK
jgi:hypothetical protein